jgi:flagella basal body P-ring formation protein FlgA
MNRLLLLLLFMLLASGTLRAEPRMPVSPAVQEPAGPHDGNVQAGGNVREGGAGRAGGAGRESGAVRAILEQAEQAMAERHDPDRYRFHAEPGWIPGSLARLPDDAIISVTPTAGPERHTAFTVRYRDGNRPRETDVQLRLTIETMIPVAAVRVTAGTRITSGHLVSQWVEVSRDRGQLVTDVAELEGMTLRRTLAMGEPVRRSDITTGYLVNAGDTVNLIFSADGMQIVLSATARQNGAANEDIRVYSEQTRRTYLATVRSPGEVEWRRTL